MTKPVLASFFLRSYPLPSAYILKAGELSVDEKSRLSSLVAEEISKLGKIINRYTDVARTLFALLNVLQGDPESGEDPVSIDMVRGVVLHSLHCGDFCFTMSRNSRLSGTSFTSRTKRCSSRCSRNQSKRPSSPRSNGPRSRRSRRKASPQDQGELDE